MTTLLSLWLLFTATPLLAKSVGYAAIDSQKGAVETTEKSIATSLLDQADPRSSLSSIPERFLQIAHKVCQGPEGEPGTCMFNFECQQQQGHVVGACLDGFLFGACCHLDVLNNSNFNSSLPEKTSILSNQTNFAMNSTEQADIKWLSQIITNSSVSLKYGNQNSATKTGSHLTDQLTQHDTPALLPLVLLFRNDSNENQKTMLAPSSQPSESFVYGFSTSNLSFPKGGVSSVSESSVRDVPTFNFNNKILSPLGDEGSVPLTAFSDNQISVSSIEIPPTTVGSALFNKEDPILQQQLAALFQAHSVSSVAPTELEPTSATTSRTPIRNKGQSSKRPRPKPTISLITSTASTRLASTSETSTSEETKPYESTSMSTLVTESLTDQQANVLQFLVSNPPAWVLDEIINGSSLTTWYPLPIPEDVPDSSVDQPFIEVTSFPELTFASTPSLKKKPIKNRPLLTTITSSTTPTFTLDQSENEESLQSVTISSSTTITPAVTSLTISKKPNPVLDYSKDCGVRPMVPEARIVGGRRSDYGRWPWQVLIRESTWFGIFSKNKCGGVLISDRHVLTAAHCQPGFLGSLLVVLGEFDLTGHSEPQTPVEKNVKRVVVHRDYVERTFENDLAILELDSPVEFKPYIVPICLPSTSEGDFVGKKAEVTGWGKLSHNGPTPGVLYEVDVPIMSNQECHDMFKKAGHEKRILDSFLCAGYTEGKKDSCEGDSGGPLMLERDDGRWSLVGTVSHGIRCAYPNMPGVYMRMTYYRPWIERVTGIGGTQLGR